MRVLCGFCCIYSSIALLYLFLCGFRSLLFLCGLLAFLSFGLLSVNEVGDTSLDEELANATCQHTAEFFANPELAAQVIEMQRQQLIALGLIQAPIYIDDLTGGGGDGIVPDPAP